MGRTAGRRGRRSRAGRYNTRHGATGRGSRVATQDRFTHGAHGQDTGDVLPPGKAEARGHIVHLCLDTHWPDQKTRSCGNSVWIIGAGNKPGQVHARCPRAGHWRRPSSGKSRSLLRGRRRTSANKRQNQMVPISGGGRSRGRQGPPGTTRVTAQQAGPRARGHRFTHRACGQDTSPRQSRGGGRRCCGQVTGTSSSVLMHGVVDDLIGRRYQCRSKYIAY
jgi:hypothetical protein